MHRFFQLLIALAALVGGLWLLYAGYGRSLSLAGKTEVGLSYVQTGFDGKARVPTHRWMYAGGLALIVGSTWWIVRGPHGPAPKRRRRR